MRDTFIDGIPDVYDELFSSPQTFSDRYLRAVISVINRRGVTANLERTSQDFLAIFDSRYDSIQRRIGDYVFNFKPGNVAIVYVDGNASIVESDILTIDSVIWKVESPPSIIYHKNVRVIQSLLCVRQEFLNTTLT